MKFRKERAVSPIIATLLLIAIAVAAGIVVYVFVNGLAGNLTQGGGQQVTERLQIQSYNFQISPGSCGCAQQVLEIFLVNSAGSSTTVSSVYYDGTLIAGGGTLPLSGTPYTISSANAFWLAAATDTMSSGGAGVFYFSASTQKGTSATPYASQDVGQVVITLTSAPTAGTAHTVKVVSTTGATNVFTVIAGKSG
jgi:flagellin-like protein